MTWLMFQYFILGILSFLAAILIGNLIYIQRLEPGRRPSGFPLVSILVPARNEEKNIEACVRSLLSQDYPDFELRVLNDHSEDRTLEILKKIAGEDSRLQILNGEELPLGWLGKCFACHQLAGRARGEYLLFTDADTVHQPGALAAAMAQAEEDGSDLLTLITALEMRTWSEKLILPLIYFIALTFLPFPLIKLAKNPKFSIGNGQFMLFRRKAYEAIGGHKAVQSALVEDVWLARHIKKNGYAVSIQDGSRMVSCRMYGTFGEVWEGFSKNIFAGVNYSLIGLSAMMIFSAAVYLMPPILLAIEIAQGHGFYGWFLPAAATSIVIALRLLLAFRFQPGPVSGWDAVSAFLHPLGMTFVLAIAVNSARRILGGQGAAWKGRTYRFHSQKI